MTKRTRVAGGEISRLMEWLQRREDEMAALLAWLVAIATENPPGKNYRACADLLENRLRRAGLECERLEVGDSNEGTGDGPVCLVASYGRGERILYFHGHYDVVPAQSGEQFQAMRKEHFLFGRGSCDMKGGIVAMLYAVRALQECGASLNGKIALTLVPDEENGGARDNFNVVPEQCWFTVDRRINPEENLQDEKARLLEVLERCKSAGIPLEWEILQEGHSSNCKESERLGLALRQSVEAVTGQPPKFEMCPGLLEIRFYAAQRIPAYAYGPGLLSVAHGPNEYVDLRRVCDCAAIYALTAMQMLSS